MLKKLRKFLAVLLSAAALATAASAAGGGTGAAVYSNSVRLADGLTYENAVSWNDSGDRVEDFALTVTPNSSVYPIVLACDTIYGGMTITNMIRYAQSLGYNVVGAVNADFGYWSTKIPCGMVVEDGVYKSSPEGNNAIAFSNGTAVTSFMPEVNITLTNETANNSASLTHYNKTRDDAGGLYLYSEYFSTVSTRTSTDGWFVRFKVLDGEMSVAGSMTLEVSELIHGDYDALTIGKDNLILTAADASNLQSDYEKFHVGDKVTLTTSCTDTRLAGVKWISGCGNILVSDGQLFHQEWWDSAIGGTHPRTAIGIKPDGTLVYYVTDGRSENSGGATMEELAKDMISMGCNYVVNMDGGGSSALSLLLPGKSASAVVNSPSDGTLRSVCSYILFVTDETPSGKAENLYIAQDGAFVLTGSSLALTYLATDNTLKTVGTPSEVTASASLGKVANGVYTAGAAAGVDTVSLSSSAGAAGSGSIHVISKADTLTVTNAETGTAVSSATLEQGETLSLKVGARYLSRAVTMDASAVTYEVTGDVGTVTKDGVFTAAGEPGAEGKIVVTVAGLKAEVAIKLPFEFSDMRGHWAADYVKSLYKAGIVDGITDKEFFPENSMKRGDFILMLYRAAGKPAVTAPAAFTDVPPTAYYADAIAWAESAGIAQGVTDSTFNPDATLTREQGFTFLYRALGALKVTYTDADASGLSAFVDASKLSDWAVTPAATLVYLGIIEGGGNGIEPAGTLTRCQMAKMLFVAVSKK